MKEETGPPFMPNQRVVALVSWEGISGSMLGYNKGDVFVVDVCKKSPIYEIWHVRFTGRPIDEFYDCENFAPVQEQYADLTEEIAASLKQTDETPDRIQVPEKLES